MCSHWSCLCSSYRAPRSVEEKRGSWQEQGHRETLAEVWSRRVSVASAQSSPFSGPPGVDLEAVNAPGGRGDASAVTSTATTLLEQRLTRIISCPCIISCPRIISCIHIVSYPHIVFCPCIISCLSKQLVVSILHLQCTGHSSLSYHCLRCLPRERWRVFPLSLLSGSFRFLRQTSISSHRFELELPGEAPRGETGVSPPCRSLGFGTCEATPVGGVPFGQTRGSTPAADLAGGRVSMGTGWGCAGCAGGEGAVGRGQGWSPSLRAAGCAVILRSPDLPSSSECSK